MTNPHITFDEVIELLRRMQIASTEDISDEDPDSQYNEILRVNLYIDMTSTDYSKFKLLFDEAP